jgi:arylsulfatase A-like enzyme
MDQVSARKKTYQKLIKDYLRCGAVIDENIGRLLQSLENEGIDENTIVIYVSDQGYFLGEHGFFDKRMMYEESLRMPFVIRYPKEIPAGTRNNDIILNVDFATLLADYAHVNVPEKSQGHSFRQNLKGNTSADWRQAMYYRYWTQHKIRPAHLGIRNQQYKLMFLYGDRLNTTGSDDVTNIPAWEFYDLKEDPLEDKNQYNNPKYTAIIEQMKKDLMELRNEAGDTDMNTPKMQEIIENYYW